MTAGSKFNIKTELDEQYLGKGYINQLLTTRNFTLNVLETS